MCYIVYIPGILVRRTKEKHEVTSLKGEVIPAHEKREQKKRGTSYVIRGLNKKKGGVGVGKEVIRGLKKRKPVNGNEVIRGFEKREQQ